MISVVSVNCKGFIKQNIKDARAEMLTPLALLTDNDRMKTESNDSILYKKACDLYNHIIVTNEDDEYKRFSLLAAELKLKHSDKILKKYGLLSTDELEYMLDFIETYGGFAVYPVD